MQVEKQWIDYNGHLNMAYYNVLFDRCADEAFELFGMGPGYAQAPPDDELHGRNACLLRSRDP